MCAFLVKSFSAATRPACLYSNWLQKYLDTRGGKFMRQYEVVHLKNETQQHLCTKIYETSDHQLPEVQITSHRQLKKVCLI